MTIDPGYVINMIVESYDRPDTVPTPEEIDARVNEFLQTGPLSALRASKDEIVVEVLRRLTTKIGAASILENNEGHEEWLLEVDKTAWSFWPRLSEYLQHAKDFSRNVIIEMERSTDYVLGRLESPSRPASWDRRGLVFGHVQSGKTTHYTALAAKALDAGYQVIIVLAGIHNSLRSQTHERLDYYLLGRDSARFIEVATRGGANIGPRHVGVGERDLMLGRPPAPNVITFTSSARNGDFRRQIAQQIGMDLVPGNRLVLVVKKNVTILENLLQWLESLHPHNMPDRRHSAPTLIIDDEADHASLDTGHDPEAEPRRINGLIRRLLSGFDRVSYVGYTATPFANIFIPPDFEHRDYGRDLFPEHFIVNLKAPSDHIGPSVVFGSPGDDSIGLPPQNPLPMFNSVADASPWMPDKHRRTHEPGPLPESLKDALLEYILACAARRCRGQIDVHNSMLIHVTRFVDVQGRVHSLVSREIETWLHILSFASGDALASLREKMKALWEDDFAAAHGSFAARVADQVLPLPGWKEVWSEVPNALRRIQVNQVNGSVDDALTYSRNPQGLYVIAIGGDKLSRGLTLEGLTISYFLRTSRIYDTLMQMGRWFGYRPGYIDLCRVFAPVFLRDRFREISLAVEELRNDLDFMADAHMTPRDFGLRMRMPSDGLLITSPDRMRSGQSMMVRFAGELVQTLTMPRGDDAENNRAAVHALITDIGRAPERSIRGKGSSHLIWQHVPAAMVVKFLNEYEAYHTSCFCRHCDGIRKFIDEELSKNELTEWTVAIISKRKPENERWYVSFGGLQTPLVERDRLESSTPERYLTQAVVGSADEAIDLTEDEYAEALLQTRANATNRGDSEAIRTPKREFVRAVRPPSRGLLLIYPIVDDENHAAECSESFVPALAISFPTRLAAGTVGYMVTEDWLRQHGAVEDWEEE